MERLSLREAIASLSKESGIPIAELRKVGYFDLLLMFGYRIPQEAEPEMSDDEMIAAYVAAGRPGVGSARETR